MISFAWRYHALFICGSKHYNIVQPSIEYHVIAIMSMSTNIVAEGELLDVGMKKLKKTFCFTKNLI